MLAVEGNVGIQGKRGDWRMVPGVIVRPDVFHSSNGNGAIGAMLFVDPESTEGTATGRIRAGRAVATQ